MFLPRPGAAGRFHLFAGKQLPRLCPQAGHPASPTLPFGAFRPLGALFFCVPSCERLLPKAHKERRREKQSRACQNPCQNSCQKNCQARTGEVVVRLFILILPKENGDIYRRANTDQVRQRETDEHKGIVMTHEGLLTVRNRIKANRGKRTAADAPRWHSTAPAWVRAPRSRAPFA